MKTARQALLLCATVVATSPLWPGTVMRAAGVLSTNHQPILSYTLHDDGVQALVRPDAAACVVARCSRMLGLQGVAEPVLPALHVAHSCCGRLLWQAVVNTAQVGAVGPDAAACCVVAQLFIAGCCGRLLRRTSCACIWDPAGRHSSTSPGAGAREHPHQVPYEQF